tara:strand:- start:205 stop:522 length:318 start_codon:yes stop_codon:yes gene_type:complete
MLESDGIIVSPAVTPGTVMVVDAKAPLTRLGTSHVVVALRILVIAVPLPMVAVVAVTALAASVGLLTVVVPPLADPTFTFVVEPAAPPVATLTVLVVALAVALVL